MIGDMCRCSTIYMSGLRPVSKPPIGSIPTQVCTSGHGPGCELERGQWTIIQEMEWV